MSRASTLFIYIMNNLMQPSNRRITPEAFKKMLFEDEKKRRNIIEETTEEKTSFRVYKQNIYDAYNSNFTVFSKNIPPFEDWFIKKMYDNDVPALGINILFSEEKINEQRRERLATR